MSLFGKNSKEGIEKFKDDLTATHNLFKDFLARHRPQLDLNELAFGQWWHAEQAIDLGVVDQIATSEQYLGEQAAGFEVIELDYEEKPPLPQRIGLSLAKIAQQIASRLQDKLAFKNQLPPI